MLSLALASCIHDSKHQTHDVSSVHRRIAGAVTNVSSFVQHIADENPKKMVATESGILNLTPSDFESIPPNARPIYGSLMAKPELSDQIIGPARYGEDLWILKEDVQERSTWTAADSWALCNDWEGRAWDHKVKSFNERDWTHLALPIDSLELTIPFPDEMGRAIAPLSPRNTDQLYYAGQIMPPRKKDQNSFIEFQIWGGVGKNEIFGFCIQQLGAHRKFRKISS